jgi:hypothetical protein
MSDGYEVEVLGASKSSSDSLLTLRLRYPRIVLAELNTHRWLSRNSGSSRAIPTPKLLAQIRNEPAMPYRFGANQPGMQDKGGEHSQWVRVPVVLEEVFRKLKWEFEGFYMETKEQILAEPRTFWRFMAWVNSLGSEAYHDAGFHKQIGNRLTEPFQWMNTIVSATTQGWIDLLKLRDHEAADPTIAHLAALIREVRKTVVYKELAEGEWHLIYILPEEEQLPIQKKLVLSTARAARVSYEPFDGNPSWEKELTRHNLLVESDPPHASPTEHQAMAMPGRWGNFVGFRQYRHFLEWKDPVS